MVIRRIIEDRIRQRLFKGKAIILYGPRQVGKTTLVRTIQADHASALYLNCDEIDIRTALTDKTSTELKSFIGNVRLVIIDEAQRVRNIGITLKLLVDAFPEVQILATGSSSFDLSNAIAEPLTGRAYIFYLFPIHTQELESICTAQEILRLKEQFLRYGAYPEVITHSADAETSIKLLTQNYLYKDALEYQTIKNTEAVHKLLQALALQIGNEVSYSELASLIGIDIKTVEKYIGILEQAFVLFRLPPLSRNRRKELSKKRKLYFWDCGVRNALINNFNPMNLRSDKGALWENFLIAQRMSKNQSLDKSYAGHFWRTWEGSEIDYVEESGGAFHGYEIKWSNQTVKPPKQWLEFYPGSPVSTIHQDNWTEFVKGNI